MPQQNEEFCFVDIIARCKQCGGAVTVRNKEEGTKGVFCSPVCRDKYEAFVGKARELDDRPVKRPFHFVRFLKKSLAWLVLLAGVAAAVIYVLTEIETVPVLTPLCYKLRAMVGL